MPLLLDAGWSWPVVGCAGPAAMSLALALAARATRPAPGWRSSVCRCWGRRRPTNSVSRWDVCGPSSPMAANGHLGRSGRRGRQTVSTLVITCPPSGAERRRAQVSASVAGARCRVARRRIVVTGRHPATSSSPPLQSSGPGLGSGHGPLLGRRAVVRVGGRRVPRRVERDFWLPGPDRRFAAGRPDRDGSDRCPVARAAVAETLVPQRSSRLGSAGPA